jgi:hypothetical protein
MKGARDAVDATLVSEMLRMTPEQRLRENDRALATALELRRAFAARADHTPHRARR